jgi:hypothetical protein
LEVKKEIALKSAFLTILKGKFLNFLPLCHPISAKNRIRVFWQNY